MRNSTWPSLITCPLARSGWSLILLPLIPFFRIIHHLGISRWVRYMPGVPSKFFLDSCGEFAPSPLVHSFFHASEPHKTFLQRLRDLLVNAFSFIGTIVDERNLNAIFRQNIDPNFPSIDSLKYTVRNFNFP